MKKHFITTTLLPLLLACSVFAQQPKYTSRPLVSYDDPKEFMRVVPAKDGFIKTYLLITPDVWDIDDDSTTYLRGSRKALVCIEGNISKGKKNGPFNVYLLDSADHRKRYRIWEQWYVNGKLNGEWKTFTLRGTLVTVANYKDDSLSGLSRNYWIDGKSVMEDRIYENGRSKYLVRKYSSKGKVTEEMHYVNGVANGQAKKYYPDGVLMDEVDYVNGFPDGIRKYYYPSGKIWIEQEMKLGKSWNVIANYTASGQRRDAGTLKDGNGTILLYDDKGKVRDTVKMRNGVQIK